MNKKLISLSALVLSALALTSCGGNTKSLVDHGMDVVALMDEKISNDELMNIYTAQDEVRAVVDTLDQGYYSDYDTVYQITLSTEKLREYQELTQVAGMSNELQEHLDAHLMASAILQMNATQGVNVLAATNMCTANKMFVYGEIPENCVYLYTFDNGTPIAVSFVSGEDGAVGASGYFLLIDGFTASSADDIAELFSDYAPEVTVVAGS